jgi:hypothetical protein
MKKLLLLFIGFVVFANALKLEAQASDPGTENLTHQWNFDDGTANDSRTPAVNGVLMGGATIDVAEGALKTVNNGDYLAFSPADLALNQYLEITFEVWCKTTSAQWNNMLFYFGDSTGGLGYKGVFQTSVSRTAISCASTSQPWSTEDNVGGATLVDGNLHHTVTVLTGTDIQFYVDGVLIGSKAYQTGNDIASLGTEAAMLAKGGYRADPTWPGLIYKFSIYDRALLSDEILYLFQQGAGGTTKSPNIKNAIQKVYVKNGQIVVDSKSQIPGLISVYNSQGKLVYKQQATSTYNVLGANLTNGIYIVKVGSNNYKVIK